MRTIKHFSDTVGYDSNNNPGITTQRLAIWYEQLAKTIGVEYQKLDFKGSAFGESFETAAQALQSLTNSDKKEREKSRVVLVNNASRAKHKNSENAAGSDCLVAELEIYGVKNYIVGVDDEIFAFVDKYQEGIKYRESVKLNHGIKALKIKKIKGIDYTLSDGTPIKIEDLSKGTQFRSKEHYPLAQLLLIKALQDNGNIDLNSGVGGLILEDFDKENFAKIVEGIRVRVAYLVRRTPRVAKELGKARTTREKLKFKSPYKTENYEQGSISTGEIIGDYVKYVTPNQQKLQAKTYVSGFDGIEQILNIGELYLLYDKLGIVYNPNLKQDYEENICPRNRVDKYNELRESLEPNQIALVHRDLFGNGFFTTKAESDGTGIDLGIDEFCEVNGFKDGEKVKISGGGVSFEVILTKNLGKHTGENCCWNSSGRGTRGEILLNINKSIGPDGKILYEIQNLPIGTVLVFSKT